VSGWRRYLPRRRTVGTLAVAGGLAVLAVLLVGKVASYASLADAIRDADWRWVPVCVAGEVLAYAGYILAYRDLARVDGGPTLSYRLITRVVATSFGAYVLSSVAGPAVDFWALRRAGARRNDAVVRILAMNALKFGVLGGAAAVAGAVLLAEGDAPLAMALPWIVVVSVCVALAAAPTDHDHSQCGLRVFEHCVNYVAREGAYDAVRGVRYVRHVLGQPLRYPAGVIGYPLYWAGDLLCLWGGLRAFGGHIGLAGLVLAYATGYVITILPLPGGGTGGVEAATTYALHVLGVPLAPALLGVVLYRVVNFWLPILPALATLPTLRRLEAQLRADAVTSDPEPLPAV
jgi:glycosyltransferase 2 family protein